MENEDSIRQNVVLFELCLFYLDSIVNSTAVITCISPFGSFKHEQSTYLIREKTTPHPRSFYEYWKKNSLIEENIQLCGCLH